MRATVWNSRCVPLYQSVHVGDVILAWGYRLAPVVSAAGRDPASAPLTYEAMINPSHPVGCVNVIPEASIDQSGDAQALVARLPPLTDDPWPLDAITDLAARATADADGGTDSTPIDVVGALVAVHAPYRHRVTGGRRDGTFTRARWVVALVHTNDAADEAAAAAAKLSPVPILLKSQHCGGAPSAAGAATFESLEAGKLYRFRQLRLGDARAAPPAAGGSASDPTGSYFLASTIYTQLDMGPWASDVAQATLRRWMGRGGKEHWLPRLVSHGRSAPAGRVPCPLASVLGELPALRGLCADADAGEVAQPPPVITVGITAAIGVADGAPPPPPPPARRTFGCDALLRRKLVPLSRVGEVVAELHTRELRQLIVQVTILIASHSHRTLAPLIPDSHRHRRV